MPKDWEGCVFARGERLYLKVKGPSGWVPQKTPFKLGQEALAEKLLKRTREALKGAEKFADDTGMVTVRSFGQDWIKTRQKLSSWKDDQSHLEQHVYPAIGQIPLEDVTPRNLREMVRALELKTINRQVWELQPDGTQKKVPSSRPLHWKTIRNVYGTCVSLFRDAAIEGQIEQTPCILTVEHLPSPADEDEDWRDDAIFEAPEVETLISDQRIPWDRRMCYAVAFLGCTRFGEMSALRWKRYDPTRQPLGSMLVRRSYSTRLKKEKSTKTKRPRTVPVHPVLASMLAEWKLRGFVEFFGHPPTPEDLIVPSRGQGKRESGNRSAGHMLKRFHEDCERVGPRVRRQHDSRRTWISMARSAGVNDMHRKWISHGPKGSDVDDDYTSMHWPDLCEVVLAIKVAQRGTIPIPIRANVK